MPCIAMARDDDVESVQSSLTSVFADLLGADGAEQVARQPFLVELTRRTGERMVSRQTRETRRGEPKRFSYTHYHRLTDEEAFEAVRLWQQTPSARPLPANVEMKLRAALEEGIPIWHVVVETAEEGRHRRGRGHKGPLDVYFMENMRELSAFINDAIFGQLLEDDPGLLHEALSGPLLQDWARQWYLTSQDFSDDKSLRLITRLQGCDVLTHCVREGFHQCVEMLLANFSRQTAQEPWLVFAEPLRYFGKFECNSLIEATYNGKLDCLRALVRHCNEHLLPWREVADKEGKNCLDIARARELRGAKGVRQCRIFLQGEYGEQEEEVEGEVVDPLVPALIIDVKDDQFNTVARAVEEFASSEITWQDLMATTDRAARHPAVQVDGQKFVMLRNVTIIDSDPRTMMDFFEFWSGAASIGFARCVYQDCTVTRQIVSQIAEMFRRERQPSWRRLCVLEVPLAVNKEEARQQIADDDVEANALADALLDLWRVLAASPHLPLLKIDRVPVSRLPKPRGWISNLRSAASDVRHYVKDILDEKVPYMPFWDRPQIVEQTMHDRSRLLRTPDATSIRVAVHPGAAQYLANCVHLWVLALGNGEEDWDFYVNEGILTPEQHMDLLSELDSGINGALVMRQVLPEMVGRFLDVLPNSLLPRLPRTEDTLERLRRRGLGGQ